jgi:phosphoserine phosphatase
MILTKFKLISNDALKEGGVKLFLKGKSKDEVERVAKNYAKTIKTNKVYKEMSFEDRVLIVSASFEEYLKPLFPKNVEIVASKLKYKDNKVEGVLFNCYSKKKIDALKQKSVEEIDRFYTDSYSDKPLAKISKEIVLVRGDNQTICHSLKEFEEFF